MKCISSAILFLFILNPSLLHTMNREDFKSPEMEDHASHSSFSNEIAHQEQTETNAMPLPSTPANNNQQIINNGSPITVMQHIAQAIQPSNPNTTTPNDDEWITVDNNNKITPTQQLNILSQEITQFARDFKNVSQFSQQYKTNLKGMLYETIALRLHFARGSEERKALAFMANTLKAALTKLTAQDKTEVMNGLYYDSDGETHAYDKFRTKDEMRKVNQATHQQLTEQIKTNLDAAAALQVEIDRLTADKQKLCEAHNKLQGEFDGVEKINDLLHSLELQDFNDSLARKESATNYVIALKNELTEAEKVYNSEKDAQRKVSLLTLLNEKRKTNNPVITEQEKLIALLTTDLDRMNKRLNPAQHNNSYLSGITSGIISYFSGSKLAQPTIEDKK